MVNKHNPYIAQHLRKQRQPDNEIWSATRETFFRKNHAENEAGRVFETSFYF